MSEKEGGDSDFLVGPYVTNSVRLTCVEIPRVATPRSQTYRDTHPPNIRAEGSDPVQ